MKVGCKNDGQHFKLCIIPKSITAAGVLHPLVMKSIIYLHNLEEQGSLSGV